MSIPVPLAQRKMFCGQLIPSNEGLVKKLPTAYCLVPIVGLAIEYTVPSLPTHFHIFKSEFSVHTLPQNLGYHTHICLTFLLRTFPFFIKEPSFLSVLYKRTERSFYVLFYSI